MKNNINEKTMKQLTYIAVVVAVVTAMIGCGNKRTASSEEQKDTVITEQTDTAIYGVVGENTSMHVLELLTEDGKVMTFAVSQDSCSDVQGGIFAGDRVTLTTRKGSGDEMEVVKLVNLTSLLGKWTSLDRNFEIQEDGGIVSAVTAESHPYTHWTVANGNLILNADTFEVLLLGPDSMTIENDKGIYVYKRQTASKP